MKLRIPHSLLHLLLAGMAVLPHGYAGVEDDDFTNDNCLFYTEPQTDPLTLTGYRMVDFSDSVAFSDGGAIANSGTFTVSNNQDVGFYWNIAAPSDAAFIEDDEDDFFDDGEDGMDEDDFFDDGEDDTDEDDFFDDGEDGMDEDDFFDDGEDGMDEDDFFDDGEDGMDEDDFFDDGEDDTDEDDFTDDEEDDFEEEDDVEEYIAEDYADYSRGGAVYNGEHAVFLLNDNATVTFSGNTASVGGAVYNGENAVFSLCGNGDVTFSGNAATLGGAVYNAPNAVFSLCGNRHVLFEKNVEVSDGTYRLRSIYSAAGSTLNLAAAEGGQIVFRDSVYADGAVNLNADYTDSQGTVHRSTGSIIFTGATTEDDLWEVKGGRDGTEEEILNSRTSELSAATLYGGRLVVEHNAVLKGRGLTVAPGAEACICLYNGTLNEGQHALRLSSGSRLESAGVSSVTASALCMESGCTLAFTVGMQNTETAVLTLTGTLEAPAGAITITLDNKNPLAAGCYKVLTLNSGTTEAVTALLNSGTVTLGDRLSAAELYWSGNTFWMKLAEAVEGQKPSYLYPIITPDGTFHIMSADKVISALISPPPGSFLKGDHIVKRLEMEEGARLLGGSIEFSEPSTVGGGLIATPLRGKGTLIKVGSGELQLAGRNTYTGGTVVKEGRLTLLKEGSLSDGPVSVCGGAVLSVEGTLNADVTLHNGAAMRLRNRAAWALPQGRTLTADGADFCGNLQVSGGSTLNIQRALTVSGDLDLQNAASITLADGAELEVQGTLTLNGTQHWNTEGGMSITCGNISEADQKALLAQTGLSPAAVTLRQDGSITITKVGGASALTDALAAGTRAAVLANHAFAESVHNSHTYAPLTADRRAALWLAALGGESSLRGHHARSTASLNGAALGLETVAGTRGTLGLAVGSTTGRISTPAAPKQRTHGTHAALYGQMNAAGNLTLLGTLAYGRTETKADFGNGQTRFNRNGAEADVRALYSRNLTESTAAGLFGGLNYRGAEHARSANYSAGSLHELRAELGGSCSTTCGGTTLYAEAAAYAAPLRHTPVTATETARAKARETGPAGVSAKLGIGQRLTEHGTLFLQGQAEAARHEADYSVSAGVQYRF